MLDTIAHVLVERARIKMNKRERRQSVFRENNLFPFPTARTTFSTTNAGKKHFGFLNFDERTNIIEERKRKKIETIEVVDL